MPYIHTQNRRDFLKTSGAAALGALAATSPTPASSAEKIKNPKATADTCILLWMGGGMAAPDTFDPKHYEPFKVGLDVNRIESTFPAIDTAVDNIKITKGLENVAKVLDRGALIRSHVLPDLGHILRIVGRLPRAAADVLAVHGVLDAALHDHAYGLVALA